MELVLCWRNHNFQCKGHCDPDFWPYDPKIIRGNVFDMAVHPIKFYSCRLIIILRYWAKTVFRFKVIVILTFDLVTQNSIGVFYTILTIIPWSLNTLGQMKLKLCSRNHKFQFKDHCDHDLWPYEPKINRGHILDMSVHPIKFYSCMLINT
jgi:hypothetical protein